MSVNPQGALKTIDSLIKRIDDLSEEEYDEELTVKKFAELVIDITRFIRLSIKGLKERDWYPEYLYFLQYSRNGIKIYSEFWDRSKKITIGIAYEGDIYNLKTILNDCRKDFKMIQQIKGKKQNLIRKSDVVELLQKIEQNTGFLEKIEKNTRDIDKKLIKISEILMKQPDLIAKKLNKLLTDEKLDKTQKTKIKVLLDKYEKITTLTQKTEFWVRHLKTLMKIAPFILSLIS